MEWVAFPFSRGSSPPRDRTQVSHIAGEFFTSWTTREAPKYWSGYPILSPVDLPDPGIELGSPALQEDSLLTELSGKPWLKCLSSIDIFLKFESLNFSHLFLSSLYPFPFWESPICSLHLLLCYSFVIVFICFVFQILHISEIIWCLSFSDLFSLT